MNGAPWFASRSGCDWQASLRPFVRTHAGFASVARARLYMEVQF